MDYILTLDLGTTNIKAIAINSELTVIGEESQTIKTHSPDEFFQQQDPDEILSVSEKIMTKVLDRIGRKGLCALVFSNAMHSIIPVDRSGNPLQNAIIWSDLRALHIVNKIKDTAVGKQLYADTGTPIHPMSPLFKIVWLKENKEDLFKKTGKFLSIKEYLLYKWFNIYITDHSTASASGLFNITTLVWSAEALDLAGITPQNLPECTGIYHDLKGESAKIFDRLGISDKTPILIGATDGCLAVLGGGKKNLDELSLSIGTSAAIRTAKSRPVQDNQGRIFNYFLENTTYISGGPSNNGGNILDWFGKNFITQNPDTLDWESVISNTPPGAKDLFFLPYLFGERAPLWNASASGSFHGIRHYHDPNLFARSILEGILMNVRSISEILDNSDTRKIIASGGAFHIPGLSQLTADIFGKTVVLLNTINLSALGAAYLGWKFLGKPVEDIEIENSIFKPDYSKTKLYSIHFRKFNDLLNNYQYQLDK